MLNEQLIASYSSYNESMKKSLLDKIFFIDKIDVKIIVDYGCADGSLIKFLSILFPEYEYIGYDIDNTMLEKARQNCNNTSFLFTSNWEEVSENIKGKISAIVLSSVIHEVYAYGTRHDVDEMWDRVFKNNFNYVVIRDMMPSISIDKRSDINDVRNILCKADSHQIRDFEQVWGSIEQNKNLVHFLLKYRYKENWKREVRENYFPISREEMISSIPEDYYIDFHEHFILPYFRMVSKRDFNIDIKDNSHIKLILKKV